MLLRGPERNGYVEIDKPIRFKAGIHASLEPFAYEYYVNKVTGRDTFDGRTPSYPKKTIAAAVEAMNARINWAVSPWAKSDILYIAPGKYVENLTSLPFGSRVVGLGDAFDLNGENGVVIKPASGSPFSATSVINCQIQNVCFESPDASPCFDVQNFNRNVFRNVIFSGVPGSSPTTTHGLRVKDTTPGDQNGDMTGSRLIGCIFQVVRNGIHITTDNASSKQASGNIIEYCYIRGADQIGIYFHVNCVPSYTIINHCEIGDGSTTLALGLDDDTGLVKVSNTNFEATACDPASGDGDSHYNHCYLNGALMT